MLKIAVCDDEKAIANQIEHLILQVCTKESIPGDTDVFFDGKSLEEEIYKGTRYDLIYMDIEMEDRDGISTAQNIRRVDENVLLVFVSGHSKYALELFRLDVFEFILKPIDRQYFETCFLNASRKISTLAVYFRYQYKRREFKIPAMDIVYFESKGRKIFIHEKDGEVTVYNGKLSDVETWALMGKVPFLRIHQSYLVNYHFITSRTKEEVRLKDGTSLYVSKERQNDIKRCYNELLKGEIDAEY